MTIVDAYARVSDDKTGEEFGVTNQLREIQAYCDERGWTVGEIFRDDSVSAGGKVTRPRFQALLNRTDKRPVVASNWDRFIRVSKDVEAVIEQDLTVYFVHTGYQDLSTPYGRAGARMFTAMATAELENKSLRAGIANAARAADGYPYWRRAPLGHTKDGQVIESEAVHVRAAVKAILAGDSLRAIAKAWNAAGVRNTSSKVDEWSPNSVKQVLVNPRLCGTLIYKGETMPKSRIAPIVSEAESQAVIGILTDPTRHNGSGGPLSNLLTGIALCGVCADGTTMIATSANGKPAYRCRAVHHNTAVRATVDQYAISVVLGRLTAPDAPSLLDAPTDLSGLSDEVTRLRAELADWAPSARSMGRVEYESIVGPIKADLEVALAAMQSADRVELFRDFITPHESGYAKLAAIGEAYEIWESLSIDRQRSILDGLYVVTLNARNSGLERVEMVRK